MKIGKYTILWCILSLLPLWANAQELRCNVSINTSRIQGTNKNIFNTLQAALSEFMNATKWTNNVYSETERIDCSFFITLTEQSGSSRFGGTLQIQARRPVYGTSYQTITFNFLDEDFTIDYIEFDRLDFDLKTFQSNLTSIMAFYAYVILGMDYDSFALKGGRESFEKAQTIVTNAQRESYIGWNPYEKASRRNRYWVINNILDNKYSSVRTAVYKYHRLGLDVLSESASNGREQIIQALMDIQRVFRDKPDSHLLYIRLFFDAKADELANIFADATEAERTQVYQILKEVDFNNEKKYEKIKNSKSLN